MTGHSTHTHDFVLLDGFRALGAVMILVGHTMPFWGPFWAPSGPIVVDAFFLISGFVIAYVSEPRFASGMKASQFILFRFIRLYPLYLLGTLLGFAVLASATIGDSDADSRIGVLGLQLVPQLFMLPTPEALGGERVFPMNGPAWTLFAEFLVNIAYVVFFRFLSTRMLMVAVGLCGAALAAMVLMSGHIDIGSSWPTFWGGLARASFGFFAGVLVFRLAGSPRSAQRPATGKAFLLLFGLPVVCFVPTTPELRPFFEVLLVVGLGMPLLYAAQSIAPPQRYARILNVGARISFALYILHAPAVLLLRRVEWRYPEIMSFAPFGGMAILAVMFVVAYVAEKYFDRPARRWIMQMIAGRRSAKIDPAGAMAD